MSGLHPRLTREVTDPATPGARVATLAKHKDAGVARLARRHANLPADDHRRLLVQGDPDAWASPQTFLLLITDLFAVDLAYGARMCVESLAQAPRPDLAGIGAALSTVLASWWETETDAAARCRYLALFAAAAGHGSPAHRRAVLVATLCARTGQSEGHGDPVLMDHIITQVEKWALGQGADVDIRSLRRSNFPLDVQLHGPGAAFEAVTYACSGNVSDADHAADVVANVYAYGRQDYIETKKRVSRILSAMIRAAVPVCPLAEVLP